MKVSVHMGGALETGWRASLTLQSQLDLFLFLSLVTCTTHLGLTWG